MRKITDISENWTYTTDTVTFFEASLPFRFNEKQLGKEIIFSKNINIEDTFLQSEIWLEIARLTGKCRIFADGDEVLSHPATIDVFRCNLGMYFNTAGEHTIEIKIEPVCENGEFFMGKAQLISVDKSHFSLDNFLGDGIHIRSFTSPDGSADMHINYFVSAPNNYDVVRFTVLGKNGEEIISKTAKPTEDRCVITIRYPEFWSGQHESYMYTLNAVILRDTVLLDEINIPFAVRSFEIDKDGFFRVNTMKRFLNAVTFSSERFFEKDREIFNFLDANTLHIRSKFFDTDIFDICDAKGVLVWFSFPCTGTKDDLVSLKEFIVRNAHHPSLSFISYPIDVDTDFAKQFVKTVKDNSLCIFTAAETQLFGEESIKDAIPDILAFEVSGRNSTTSFSDIENRFLEWKAVHPEFRFAVFASSPECIYDRHSLQPERNDCSQEYFSLWHERLWNVFCRDSAVLGYFAGPVADGETAGSRTGFVTSDRKIKKDALWFYKAHFSADEFVHICSSDVEFVAEKFVDVKCYSNTKPLSISVNSKKKKKYTCEKISDGVYIFKGIKLKRRSNKIEVTAGNQKDTMEIFRSKSKIRKI
ncbi:MAG: hypothetical protein IJE93_10300 [Clostridia bacterium]|nr:hypothetical protein [Clostridia bacterium]